MAPGNSELMNLKPKQRPTSGASLSTTLTPFIKEGPAAFSTLVGGRGASGRGLMCRSCMKDHNAEVYRVDNSKCEIAGSPVRSGENIIRWTHANKTYTCIELQY